LLSENFRFYLRNNPEKSHNMHGEKPEFKPDFYNYKDSQIKPFNQLKTPLFHPYFPSEKPYLSTF